MSFSIRFESAGDGTPEAWDRVRLGLLETLRIPPATVEQMFNQAPVTVKSGLTEEQARQYARALESVGAVVTVVAPPAASPDDPPPTEFRAEPEWWERLKVYSPPFDPTAPPVMTMTAATCRARGTSLFLGHPQLSAVEIAEIRLVSVFRLAEGRWFIDLYCRNQLRPVRLNAENVDFASFDIPPGTPRPEAIAAFLGFVLNRSPHLLTDLTTFRFLRNPESARRFSELREAESYQARLTADVLTMPAVAAGPSFLTGKEAELYRDLEDPWSRPPADPPIAPEPTPPPPIITLKAHFPSPFPPPEPPQPFYQPPPPHHPQPGAPPVFQTAPTRYPAPPAMPPGPYPAPQPFGAPPRFAPPPLPVPPDEKNYWTAARSSIALVPQIGIFLQLGILGISLMTEISQADRFKNLPSLMLTRLMCIGFYILTLHFIRAGERKAAYAYIAALFFEIFVLILGGYFFTLIAGAIIGLVVLAWVIRETLE